MLQLLVLAKTKQAFFHFTRSQSWITYTSIFYDLQVCFLHFLKVSSLGKTSLMWISFINLFHISSLFGLSHCTTFNAFLVYVDGFYQLVPNF